MPAVRSNVQMHKPPSGIIFVFGLAFTAFSCLFFHFFFKDAKSFFDAKNWTAVPAVVEASEVKSHAGDDSTTYSVHITYRYSLGGKTYRSERYSFFGGSSSGYGSKRAIVDAHPPGAEFTCYVNPKDPAQAVIERGVTKDAIIISIFIAIFFGIGLLMLLGGLSALLRRGKKGGELSGAVPEQGTASSRVTFGEDGSLDEFQISRYAQLPSGEVMMKAAVSPRMKAAGLLLIALFWNGIVSIFVMEAVDSWRSGHPEIFLTLFMIPFVLIGLGMLGGVGYFYLQGFNAVPQVYLDRAEAALGETLNLRWEFSGDTDKISEFIVTLTGTEEATYRRGTDTHTDREIFYKKELAKVGKYGGIRSGTARVPIPANTMHSFSCPNNAVRWRIGIQGVIENWPDISEEFPIVVLPKKLAADQVAAAAVEEEKPWNSL